MSLQESSLPAGGVSWILTLGVHAGGAREALLVAAGLREEDLRSPDRRIPRARSLALWRAIAACMDDPTLPVRFGQSVRPHALGVLGYLIQHARTLGELVEFIHRFQALTQSRAPIRLEHRENTVEIAQRLMPEEVSLRYPPEFVISSFTALIRSAVGESWSPRAVFLQHAPVPWAPACRRVFRSPVHFDADDSGLAIPTSDLDLPIGTHDPHLRSYLVDAAERHLEVSRSRPPWTARVLGELADSAVGREPTLADVSRVLGVGGRTLQRHLRREGTHYRELVEGVRIGRAKHLLVDEQRSISDVAVCLGYADAAAFTRAFRRWVGVTPSVWRKSPTAVS